MKKQLTGFDLKIIGIVFMLIDHIYSYLGYYLGLPKWVSLLGRFVAPLFVFLMVEGFFYTRNRKKYFIRLFTAGILMHVINLIHNLLTKKNFINPYTKEFDVFYLISGHNIFMTLSLVFAMIWMIEIILNQSTKKVIRLQLVIVSILILPFIVMSEGGIYELVLGLIFYFLRGNLKKIALAISLFSGLLLAYSLYKYFSVPGMGTLYQRLTFNNEFMIVTVLPLLYFYNGEIGGNGAKWQKLLFYLFYPIHLIILYVLRDILVGVM